MSFTVDDFPVPEPASAAPGHAPVSLASLHLDDLLEDAAARGASDLHLSAGLPPIIRRDGKIVRLNYERLTTHDVQRLVYAIMNSHQIQHFESTRELDFSYGIVRLGRYRVNVYRQRGTTAVAIRAIPNKIPSLEELRLPPILRDLVRRPSGLILVTGATGSGKSTTLACMVDMINRERECHIVTIEDPIEYVYEHRRAMVHQRELGQDTNTMQNALRAVLREDPDVILVGEMRDLDTISTALTLAETGHLVIATLHTRSAPQTVDRIVDVFPAEQQGQVKAQLGNSLEAVISQQLLPRIGGGRVPAVEIMLANSAVRNQVREGRSEQLPSCIEIGAREGMQTMDRALLQLVRMGAITIDTARAASLDPDNLTRLAHGFGA